MATDHWRRFHGAHVIAHVRQVGASWEALVWPGDDPTTIVRAPRRFASLRSAKAAADALARKYFGHRCDFSVCGEWMRWFDPPLPAAV
jgi:hypothetical protein